MTIMLHKEVGETPLECLERERARLTAAGQTQYADLPMTYAGRLDPMAEGQLLILVGEECKEREKYLGLDKEYEVEIVFGVATDTYDALGLIKSVKAGANTSIGQGESNSLDEFIKNIPKKYVGKFDQPYPPFSSKHVNGKALFEHARGGSLEDIEVPAKVVEIYSIEIKSIKSITGEKLTNDAISKISKVKGDFRQRDIVTDWNNFKNKYADNIFKSVTMHIKCSSGTYMRSLAEKMGNDMRVGAVAMHINRTGIMTP